MYTGTGMDEAFSTVDLGRAIRRLREHRGMTQAALAEWLGVSRQTVVSMERGGPVSITAVMRAITLLGARVIVVPKSTTVVEAGRVA